MVHHSRAPALRRMTVVTLNTAGDVIAGFSCSDTAVVTRTAIAEHRNMVYAPDRTPGCGVMTVVT